MCKLKNRGLVLRPVKKVKVVCCIKTCEESESSMLFETDLENSYLAAIMVG